MYCTKEIFYYDSQITPFYSRFHTCCFPNSTIEDNSSIDSDVRMKSLTDEQFQRPVEGGNVYQEVHDNKCQVIFMLLCQCVITTVWQCVL